MAYVTSSGMAGVDVTAAASTTAAWTPGTEVNMSDGSKWKYLSIPTSTTIIQYACYIVATGGNSNTAVAALTAALAARGGAMAIAQQAVTSDSSNVQYMWFLIANPFGNTSYKVRVIASTTVDTRLSTVTSSQTAGSLDDTTAGSNVPVVGIVLTDSQPSGSSGSRTFRTANYPLGFDRVV